MTNVSAAGRATEAHLAPLLAGGEQEDEPQQWEAWYTYLTDL